MSKVTQLVSSKSSLIFPLMPRGQGLGEGGVMNVTQSQSRTLLVAGGLPSMAHKGMDCKAGWLTC